MVKRIGIGFHYVTERETGTCLGPTKFARDVLLRIPVTSAMGHAQVSPGGE